MKKTKLFVFKLVRRIRPVRYLSYWTHLPFSLDTSNHVYGFVYWFHRIGRIALHQTHSTDLRWTRRNALSRSVRLFVTVEHHWEHAVFDDRLARTQIVRLYVHHQPYEVFQVWRVMVGRFVKICDSANNEKSRKNQQKNALQIVFESRENRVRRNSYRSSPTSCIFHSDTSKGHLLVFHRCGRARFSIPILPENRSGTPTVKLFLFFIVFLTVDQSLRTIKTSRARDASYFF